MCMPSITGKLLKSLTNIRKVQITNEIEDHDSEMVGGRQGKESDSLGNLRNDMDDNTGGEEGETDALEELYDDEMDDNRSEMAGNWQEETDVLQSWVAEQLEEEICSRDWAMSKRCCCCVDG